MMEYARSRGTFKSTPDVIEWGKRIGAISDEDLRLEFIRIQLNLAKVINKDVYGPAGMFYGGHVGPEEMLDRLKHHGDHRPFDTRDGMYPFMSARA
jgi:hypothetical protein